MFFSSPSQSDFLYEIFHGIFLIISVWFHVVYLLLLFFAHVCGNVGPRGKLGYMFLALLDEISELNYSLWYS